MDQKVWGLNIYTKTVKDGKHEKIIGVIEGSVTKMMKAYPDEFSFMRHETKRSLRAKGIKKSSQYLEPCYTATWESFKFVKNFFDLHIEKYF